MKSERKAFAMMEFLKEEEKKIKAFVCIHFSDGELLLRMKNRERQRIFHYEE
jgi:hypothetical protein